MTDNTNAPTTATADGNKWLPLNAADIRRELSDSYDGRSYRYVYARQRAQPYTEGRIVDFKHHRGLPYGRMLHSGKWVVIMDWQVR